MTLVLIVIYFCFISLGLPDSIVGTIWPLAHLELGVPLAAAGAISMVCSVGTILSSLFCVRVVRALGTARVTAISIFLTAVGIVGYSFAPSLIWMMLFAVPLGFGAGAVDAALNNFVALHYSARQMSWLHCFWGIGATAGPIILSAFLAGGIWRSGLRVIAGIQFVLLVSVLAALPRWRQLETAANSAETKQTGGLRDGLRQPGALSAMLAFFCYSGVEVTAGLWASSYLVGYRGVGADTAARWVSLYYAGITLGRFLVGFAAGQVKNTALIRGGELTLSAACVLLLLPLDARLAMPALILLGLGCAPIFPCMLHESPVRFGAANSQALISLQMACSYVGVTVLPPLFGLLADNISLSLFPWYLLVCAVLVLALCERLARLPQRR